MKRVFLLIVAPALLAALGFAQTPTATSNSDQTSIKGCLGGTDGNFTIAEDNTGQTFKITTSSVDLKPQVGHDIKLTGHKTSGAGSAGSADNSLAVTEMSMISEHCAAAAAAPAATVSTSPGAISPAAAPAAAPEASVSTPAVPPTPDNSASTPAAVTAAPAVTATPAATVNTPAASPTAPDTIEPAPAAPAEAPKASAITPLGAAGEAGNATVSTPPAAAVEPAATVIASAAPAEPKATVSAPAAAAAHLKHPSARLQKGPAKAAAAATTTPDETAKPPVADAAPEATASTPAETASTTTPAPAKPAKSSWGMSLGIVMVVLVLLAGATAPLISRWRKRRLLEKTGVQNLSFSHTAASDPGKSDTPIRRKAA